MQFNSPTAQEKALSESEMTIRSLYAVPEGVMGMHTPAIALCFPYECFSSRLQVSAVSHLPLFAQQGEKAFYSPFLNSKLTVDRAYRTIFIHNCAFPFHILVTPIRLYCLYGNLLKKNMHKRNAK